MHRTLVVVMPAHPQGRACAHHPLVLATAVAGLLTALTSTAGAGAGASVPDHGQLSHECNAVQALAECGRTSAMFARCMMLGRLPTPTPTPPFLLRAAGSFRCQVPLGPGLLHAGVARVLRAGDATTAP